MKKILLTALLAFIITGADARPKKKDRIENIYLPEFFITDSATIKIENFDDITRSQQRNIEDRKIYYNPENYGISLLLYSDNIRRFYWRDISNAFIPNALSYDKNDIKIVINNKYDKDKIYSGYVLRDKNGTVIDTVLTNYRYRGFNNRLKNNIIMSQYVTEQLDSLKGIVKEETDKRYTLLLRCQEAERKEIQRIHEKDSINRVRREEQLRLQEEARAREAAEENARVFASRVAELTTHFHAPTSQVQTKSYTSALGATITYSYYMENGMEVRHGKYTAKINYDYTYIDGERWTGYELFECNYRNGIMHGNYKYDRQITKRYNGINRPFNLTINVNVWNSFIDGQFNFTNGEFRYQGHATHGILDNITITRLSDSKSVSASSDPDGDRSTPVELATKTFPAINNQYIIIPRYGVPTENLRVPYLIFK